MVISKEEKEHFKPYFDLIENEIDFKSMIYCLYVNHRYSYQSIVFITRHVYRNTNTKEIIQILEKFDVKRCSKEENCKSPGGYIQSRSNFCSNKNINDKKNSICSYCIKYNTYFKNADQTKKDHMLKFQEIKQKDKQDEFLINLYKSSECTSKYLAAISLRGFEYIISLLERYNIKRCGEKENCKAPNGCIQPTENFNNCKTKKDGQQRICFYCSRFNDNFKNADQIKQTHMLEFQKIKKLDKQDKFLIDLYKKRYSSNELSTISLRKIEDIINLLERYNIKRCSQRENCKSPDGYIQSRENFNSHNYTVDEKQSICSYCVNFNFLFKNADQTKQNHMLEFQKIKKLDEQDKFLINLYKIGYTSKYLAAISLKNINNITNLLIKYNIKRCPQCNIIQSRNNNFSQNINRSDRLLDHCKSCQHKYYLKNIYKFAQHNKIYNLINSEKIVEYCKNYRIRSGNYHTYAPQLEFVENIRRDVNNDQLIQVRCKNCREWFNPTNQQLVARINAINGHYSIGTENNLYCSDTCKNSCSLYKTQVSTLLINQRFKNSNLTKEDFKRMQQELRSYFLKIRNPDRCELCDKEANQEDLILHHKIPVAIDNMLEADDYNVVFVCQECDKLAHQKDGCKTGQLAQFSIEDKLC